MALLPQISPGPLPAARDHCRSFFRNGGYEGGETWPLSIRQTGVSRRRHSKSGWDDPAGTQLVAGTANTHTSTSGENAQLH
jgi:hypothetical protein